MPTERLQRIVLILALVALAIYLVERLLTVLGFFATNLLIFAVAWLIAVILRPIVARVERVPLPALRRASRDTPQRYIPHGIAVMLVFLVLGAGLLLLFVSLLPVLASQLASLGERLPGAVTNSAQALQQFETMLKQFGFGAQLSQILRPERLAEQVSAIGSQLIQQSITLAGGLAAGIFNAFLVIILSFYITLDATRLGAGLMHLIPAEWREAVRAFLAMADHTFGGFMRAQLLNSLIYAAAATIVMAMFGLSNIAFVAVVSAVLVFVPLVGGFVALIPPALVALIDAPDRLVALLFVLLIIQQVQFNVLAPRLVGQIIGMHPLLVFAALLFGGTIGGGWGVLFGIPVAGVISAAAQFILSRRTSSARPT